MRIDLEGDREIWLDAEPDEVATALADPADLRTMLGDLLHPDSTPDRWVVARMRAGPARIDPAVAVQVTRDGDRVTITGEPVEGATRTHLDITMDVAAAADGGTTVDAGWRARVEVSGPQLVVSGIRPLLDASARSTSRRIADRLRRRFDTPIP